MGWIVLSALAGIGALAVLNSGRRGWARSMRTARDFGHVVGVVFRALFAAAVILAVEYATVVHASDNRALVLGVLAVPALVAGASIARMVTVSTDLEPMLRGGRG